MALTSHVTTVKPPELALYVAEPANVKHAKTAATRDMSLPQPPTLMLKGMSLAKTKPNTTDMKIIAKRTIKIKGN